MFVLVMEQVSLELSDLLQPVLFALLSYWDPTLGTAFVHFLCPPDTVKGFGFFFFFCGGLGTFLNF
jgi:hypothetical protein